MTIGKKWPCQDCQRHTPTCHGSCSEYRGEKAKQDAAAEKALKRKIILNEYVDCAIKKTKGRPGGLVKNYRPKERR